MRPQTLHLSADSRH